MTMAIPFKNTGKEKITEITIPMSNVLVVPCFSDGSKRRSGRRKNRTWKQKMKITDTRRSATSVSA